MQNGSLRRDFPFPLQVHRAPLVPDLAAAPRTVSHRSAFRGEPVGAPWVRRGRGVEPCSVGSCWCW